MRVRASSGAITASYPTRSRPMSARFWFAPLVLAIGALVPTSVQRQPTSPVRRRRGAAQDSAATTTLDDQVELAVTVYNSDIALVRDVRNLQIARGTSDLHFMDIAATVNPATVHFRSLTEPSRVSVLEQNYEYDLLEPEKLLRKYVGRDVTLVRTRQDRQHDARGRREGAAAQLQQRAGLADRRRDRHRHAGRSHQVSGAARQSLLAADADLDARQQRRHAAPRRGVVPGRQAVVERGLRADRRARRQGGRHRRLGDGRQRQRHVVQEREAAARRRRSEPRPPGHRPDGGRCRRGRTLAAAAPAMSQEAFSDYHLYTLGRKTTINNSETKQVSMLGATAFPVQKRYVVDGQAFYYRNAQHPGAPIKDVVQVYYQFKNDEKAGLGMPMPAGTVRVYQSDSKGGVQFVGEDRIDHTPKDETLNLKIGNAFDVVCERKQTDFQKIASNVYEVEYEITLRNHKATPVAVEVNEPIGGTWRMLQSSHEWTKTSAWAAQFAVPVAADGTAVLKYRVRVTY